MADNGGFDNFVDDAEDDAFEEAALECGLHPDGLCSLSGTEQCDFECPFRDSGFYAGKPVRRGPRRIRRTEADKAYLRWKAWHEVGRD